LIYVYGKGFNSDGLLYIATAKRFASGEFKAGLQLCHFPIYPLLIAAFHSILSNWEVAGRLVSVSAFIGALIPLYLMTRDLFNRTAALWAIGLFILIPEMSLWSVDILRGPTFLFFFAWSLYLTLITLDKPRTIVFGVAALTIWLSVFTRIEGLILLPFFLLVLMDRLLFDKKRRPEYIRGTFIWIVLPLAVGLAALMIGGSSLGHQSVAATQSYLHTLFEQGLMENFWHIYGMLNTMEDASPYPGGHFNFAELARRLMPFIYAVGILEALVVVMFPSMAILLIWGMKQRPWKRSARLLAIFSLAYLLMLYMSLVQRDFIQKRFLIPAVLMFYPWVGAGMEKINVFIRRVPKAYWGIPVLIFFLGIAPISRTVDALSRKDNVQFTAGQWLSNTREIEKARIVTNDKRVLFYAGMDYYQGKGERYIYYKPGKKHAPVYNIGMVAREKGMDVIIISGKLKRRRPLTTMPNYHKVKEFNGSENYVLIYADSQWGSGIKDSRVRGSKGSSEGRRTQD